MGYLQNYVLSVKYMGIELGRERVGDVQHSPGARTCVFAHAEQDWWRDTEQLFLPQGLSVMVVFENSLDGKYQWGVAVRVSGPAGVCTLRLCVAIFGIRGVYAG